MTIADIGGAFLVGLTAFFSPCVLPVLPVYVSTLMGGIGEHSDAAGKTRLSKRSLLRVCAFALGVAVTFSILGLAFGALGHLISSMWFLIACAAIVIVIGIYQTGLFSLPFLMRERRLDLKPRGGVLGAFLLGFTYSFGWTPCVGLSLGGVLLYATPQGIAVAALTLLVYALGFIIPFFVVAVFSGALLSKLKTLGKHLKLIRIIGGVIIVAMGVYLLVDTLIQNL